MEVQAVSLTRRNQVISLSSPALYPRNKHSKHGGLSEMQAPQYLSEKDGAPAGVVPSRC